MGNIICTNIRVDGLSQVLNKYIMTYSYRLRFVSPTKSQYKVQYIINNEKLSRPAPSLQPRKIYGLRDCIGFSCHNTQPHVQRRPNFESVSRDFGRIIRTSLGEFDKIPQIGLNHDVEMTLIIHMVLSGA